MARPATTTALALAVLAAAGGVGWLIYERTTAGDPAAPPLIRADDGPVKIRPKDPGGMAVPDQDKLIYQTLDGGVVEETVERLLPPPEEPLPPPEPPETPEPEMVEEPPPAAEPAVQDSAIPPLPPAEIESPAEIDQPAEVPAVVEAPSATPEPVVEAPKEAPKEPAAPAPAVADGPYMVQLASFRSIDDADTAWRRAVKKNGDLLSPHTARVVRADLGGDMGIYYRLRLGPFVNREEAKSLCAKLKSRSVDCIVVRP